MLIDWFTVAAQALNFVILLWLMKRFLYAPILHALDAREQRIAAELKDADAKKTEANKQREEFEGKNAAFDQQRAELLSKATDEVKSQARAMLDIARKTADDWTTKRQEVLRSQADELGRAIEDSARNEVLAITRKALQELATTDLESSMVAIFMQRLSALDGQAKEDLVAALKTASPPTISSALALPTKHQKAIQKMVSESFSSDTPLRFEIRPDLVCGIELSANGQLVSWNVDGYLLSLKKAIAQIASERKTQTSATAPPPEPQCGGDGKQPSGTDKDVAEPSPAGDAPPTQVNAA
ncbi:MAG: hypothetical protein WBP11_13430 [Dokdonella sp.]